ncbi:MAG TPA: dihydropteroate synthase [Alphaproteobacteria bacterium]|nr:dihydropteroate synthase [Alphaproteobacteria bacterium]
MAKRSPSPAAAPGSPGSSLRCDGGAIRRTRAPAGEVQQWAARTGTWAEERLTAFFDGYAALPPPFAGLTFDRARVMGVVNVTPDSFSDGGDFASPEAAVSRGRAMAAAGADVLDIGGESTRPGSDAVPETDEIARVLPVIRALAGDVALVSTDTRKSAVMTAAIGAGARIVNDVSALTFDPNSPATVARARVPVILMHAQGDPKTMQRDPRYIDPALDVFDVLEERLAAAVAAGISRADIMVDPGIGFGKGMKHNLAILAELALFKALGVGVLLGVSRKSFIGRIASVPDPKDRLAGSLALALHGLDRGADMVRVHDVPETVQALALWRAMRNVS